MSSLCLGVNLSRSTFPIISSFNLINFFNCSISSRCRMTASSNASPFGDVCTRTESYFIPELVSKCLIFSVRYLIFRAIVLILSKIISNSPCGSRWVQARFKVNPTTLNRKNDNFSSFFLRKPFILCLKSVILQKRFKVFKVITIYSFIFNIMIYSCIYKNNFLLLNIMKIGISP